MYRIFDRWYAVTGRGFAGFLKLGWPLAANSLVQTALWLTLLMLMGHFGAAQSRGGADQSRALRVCLFETAFVGGAQTFVNRGTSGGWRAVLTDEDSRAYEAHASRNLAPDAARWLATGEL